MGAMAHKDGKMASHMKTTIELPDDLFVAAKKRAAELRCTLRELVEQGLRLALARRGAERKPARRRIRWVTVAGGLPFGLDVKSRAGMHDWIRKHP